MSLPGSTGVRRTMIVGVGLGVIAAAVAGGYAAARRDKDAFSRSTIDVGIVVSDIEKAAAFYKNALGFREVPGFDVSAKMGAGSGLTDGHAFRVRVFILKLESTATKIKLIEFPKVPSKKVDHQFIHSSLGYSYLTIFVSDTTAAVERARKAGAVFVKDEPYRLSDGTRYLTLVRDPDGNIIELVGPKK